MYVCSEEQFHYYLSPTEVALTEVVSVTFEYTIVLPQVTLDMVAQKGYVFSSTRPSVLRAHNNKFFRFTFPVLSFFCVFSRQAQNECRQAQRGGKGV